MSDSNRRIARLQEEVERIRKLIGEMSGMPDIQHMLQAQLAQKERELAELRAGIGWRTPHAMNDFGRNNSIGNMPIGLEASRDMIKSNLFTLSTDAGPALRLLLLHSDGTPSDQLMIGEEATLALELEHSAPLPALDLQLSADGDQVAWPDGRERTLRLRPAARGKLPRWSLVPQAAGTLTLRVLVLSGGRLVQQLATTVDVSNSSGEATAPVQELPTVAVGWTLNSAPELPNHASDVTLIFANDNGRYRLMLLDGSATSVSLALTPNQLADMLQRARAELLAVATSSERGVRVYERGVQISEATANATLKRLAQLGAYLWQNLFAGPGSGRDSQELGERLRRHSHAQPLNITVAGDQLAFPWHLLYDRDPNGEVTADGFWGLRHALTIMPTSGRSGPRHGDLHLGPALTLLPCYNLHLDRRVPHVIEGQRTALHSLNLTALDEISDETALRDAFKAGTNADIIYLYCHAVSATPDGQGRGGTLPGVGSTRLILTDERNALMLSDLQTSAPISQGPTLRNGPLVVLNACGSATLSPLVYDGLVPYLLDKGARAVVGTECDTPIIFGAAFGPALLAAFVRERLPIAEALRVTRQHFLEQQRNALGLLYTLYGSADLACAE